MRRNQQGISQVLIVLKLLRKVRKAESMTDIIVLDQAALIKVEHIKIQQRITITEVARSKKNLAKLSRGKSTVW